LPISVSSSSLGITPASESFDAFTIAITLISLSFRLRIRPSSPRPRPSLNPVSTQATNFGTQNRQGGEKILPWSLAVVDPREELDWGALAGRVLHPTQMAVVEAMLWVERPVSPVQLMHLLGSGTRLPSVAYHVRRLSNLGVVKQTNTRQVRGTVEHFFSLNGTPSDAAA
jgi:hypothetical protein